MRQGSLILMLHAHLPYVRHPQHDEMLEEDWLYEAILETYLPLLEVFDRLVADRVPFRMTMTLTPPLVSMLRDPLLVERASKRIDKMVELCESEVKRTAKDATFQPLARFYQERMVRMRSLYHDRYKKDLVGAFKKLQNHGVLDVITCGATHGFLPLLNPQPEAVRAQISVAAAHYRTHFGRDPKGIWLPECGYYPGVERYLAAEGIRYFFVDSHALLDANPRPHFGVYAPLYTKTGVAAFARDPESSQQVWSSQTGYPGDPVYREFYRDVGFDLDHEYVKPYIQPTGERKNTGIKYYRVTGKVDLGHKQPYDPRAAREKAALHAGHFMFNREKQIEHLAGALGRHPVVVAPYDAELYGHWWFEGPDFLEFLIRKVHYDQKVFSLTTPAEFLSEHPAQQQATPAWSSWGAGGYADVWLDPSNDWIYRHLHKAAERMIQLAKDHPDEKDLLVRRALNQAARELLLAQSSDWAFIMKTGTMVPYAVQRTRDHVLGFTKLWEQVRLRQIDERWLAALEAQNAIFPEIDYRVYRPAA